VNGATSQQRELIADARSIGVSLSSTHAEALGAYLKLLYFWNQRVQLTAVPRQDAARLHVLDSLTTLPFVPPSASVADLGTGAGLPGLVIAITRADCRLTLVESRRKRCSFLLDAVHELGLVNVTVAHDDARSLAARSERFDVVVSRAFLAAPEFVRLAAPLARSPGGRVLVMLGRPSAALVESLGADCGLIRLESTEIVLPGGEEHRQLITLAHPGQG